MCAKALKRAHLSRSPPALSLAQFDEQLFDERTLKGFKKLFGGFGGK